MLLQYKTFVYRSLYGSVSSFLVGRFLGVESLSPVGRVCSTFCDMAKLLCKVPAPPTCPPAASKSSSSCTSFPAVVVACLFDCSHPSGFEVVSHCGLNLHFPTDW